MYKTANGWTKETIKKHVIANFKGQSAILGNGCLYYGEAGAKCAIGMFIPDSEYKTKFENLSVESLLRDNPQLTNFMPIEHIGLESFQESHDKPLRNDCLPSILNFIDTMVEE